jgi:ATP-dependent DNA helicase RecQ
VNQPQVTFLHARYPADKIALDEKAWQQKRNLALDRAAAVIQYATHERRCRSQLLLEYFDQIEYQYCGLCDICVTRYAPKHLSEADYLVARRNIFTCLERQPYAVDDLVAQVDMPEETVVRAIRQLLDQKEIGYDTTYRLVKMCK